MSLLVSWRSGQSIQQWLHPKKCKWERSREHALPQALPPGPIQSQSSQEMVRYPFPEGLPSLPSKKPLTRWKCGMWIKCTHQKQHPYIYHSLPCAEIWHHQISWYMMLYIFSCAYWPFVYLLWADVYSEPFEVGCLFLDRVSLTSLIFPDWVWTCDLCLSFPKSWDYSLCHTSWLGF